MCTTNIMCTVWQVDIFLAVAVYYSELKLHKSAHIPYSFYTERAQQQGIDTSRMMLQTPHCVFAAIPTTNDNMRMCAYIYICMSATMMLL